MLGKFLNTHQTKNGISAKETMAFYLILGGWHRFMYTSHNLIDALRLNCCIILTFSMVLIGHWTNNIEARCISEIKYMTSSPLLRHSTDLWQSPWTIRYLSNITLNENTAIEFRTGDYHYCKYFCPPISSICLVDPVYYLE